MDLRLVVGLANAVELENGCRYRLVRALLERKTMCGRLARRVLETTLS
jgi:hypothetical protein